MLTTKGGRLMHRSPEHLLTVCGYVPGDKVRVVLRVPDSNLELIFKPDGTESFSEAHPDLAQDIANALYLSYRISRKTKPRNRESCAARFRQQCLALEVSARRIWLQHAARFRLRRQSRGELEEQYQALCRAIASQFDVGDYLPA